MSMKQLVADRFVAASTGAGGFAFDLARGRPAWLEVANADDPEEQRRWLLRCDELFRLRHHAIAPLIDYGPLGQSRRFEAWSCTQAWCGPEADARAALDGARVFLVQNGLTSGAGTLEQGAQRVYVDGAGPVVILPADAGYGTPLGGRERLPAEGIPGVALVDRPAVATLSELLHTGSERRPTAAALWGPRGSGLNTAIVVLAREARLKGFVPIDVRALTAHRDLLAGRTLFLIDREPYGAVLAPLVRATIRTPRAHVCLLAGARQPRGIGGVAIGRIRADALVAALRPRAPTPAIEERWQRTARRAHGLPARFARSLSPGPIRWRRPPAQPSRVAEHPAVYGGIAAAGESDGGDESQIVAEDSQNRSRHMSCARVAGARRTRRSPAPRRASDRAPHGRTPRPWSPAVATGSRRSRSPAGLEGRDSRIAYVIGRALETWTPTGRIACARRRRRLRASIGRHGAAAGYRGTGRRRLDRLGSSGRSRARVECVADQREGPRRCPVGSVPRDQLGALPVLARRVRRSIVGSGVRGDRGWATVSGGSAPSHDGSPRRCARKRRRRARRSRGGPFPGRLSERSRSAGRRGRYVGLRQARRRRPRRSRSRRIVRSCGSQIRAPSLTRALGTPPAS